MCACKEFADKMTKVPGFAKDDNFICGLVMLALENVRLAEPGIVGRTDLGSLSGFGEQAD